LTSKNFQDEITDFNPKSWLSKYRKTTIPYLLKMAFFYHGIGVALMFASSAIILAFLPDYEVPEVPVSIIMAITAGPVEESIFFGIPSYLFGNIYAVLGMGFFWSAVHILNTDVIDINNLAYGSFLFAIPHIFFSLRTWTSGKGWFAIVFHSSWNIAFLLSYCTLGITTCGVFSPEGIVMDILVIIIACSLVSITYLLYKKNTITNYQIKYLILIPIAVFAISQVVAAIINIKAFFPAL